MERLQHAASSMNMQQLLSVKAVPYVLLGLAALTLIVKYFQGKQHRSAVRPRSPDPEKPADVNTFAAKRMKDSERKPGSRYIELDVIVNRLTTDFYCQPGRPRTSNAPKHPLTLTGP